MLQGAWRRIGAVALVAAMGTGAAAQAPAPAPAAAELLPASLFYKPADLADVKLSPSGDLLAVRTGSSNGRVGLFVIHLKEPAKSASVARFVDADVRSFQWVGNGRLVFDLIDTQEGSGDQSRAPGLFSVTADGREMRMLVRMSRPFITGGGRAGAREPLPYNHVLLHVPTQQVEGEEHVIVGEIKLDARYEVREVLAKRLNIVNGVERSLSIGVPDRVYAWHFDQQGEPRVVEAFREGRALVHHRAAGGNEWKLVSDTDWRRPPWFVQGVDGNTMYVRQASGPAGVQELKRFDLERGQLDPAAFVSTPGFDFRGGLVRETDGGAVLGVRAVTDATSTVWLAPAVKVIQAAVDARLPGHINELICRRCLGDDPVVLVRSYADTDPGRWYVYRHAKGEWNPVGAVRSDVDPRRMATLDFHRIKARDGLELPVWVTLPRGVKPNPQDPSKAPPAVVMVHGGPWVRGTYWGWQPMEQFLASRGYVVIAPEFRGSTGFGLRHYRAGIKQWGLAMQDDVADAVAWAVKQGYANPERVCIAGASYGGYSALMGLVRHPELYRCAVAWVAVTDPLLIYAGIWNSDLDSDNRRFFLPELMGDPVKDAEMLKAVSPLQHAAKITRPLLLAMGQADRRVPIEHGDQLNKAMLAAGLKPEYVVYPGEGHGWLLQETRRDFHQRVERFLAEHLR